VLFKLDCKLGAHKISDDSELGYIMQD